MQYGRACEAQSFLHVCLTTKTIEEAIFEGEDEYLLSLGILGKEKKNLSFGPHIRVEYPSFFGLTWRLINLGGLF